MSVAPATNARIGGKVEGMLVEALSLDLGEGADWADSTSDTFAMEHPSTSSDSPSWIRDGFALKKYRQAGEGEEEVGEESFDVFGASTSFEESAVSMSWMVAASPTRDSYTSREESTSSFEEGSAVARAMAGALARALPAPVPSPALRIDDSFLVAWQAACAARGLTTAEDEFRLAGTVADVLHGCLRLVTSAFSHGVEPKLTDSVSTGGSYFLEDLAGHSVGVFKPEDEEPYAVNNPKSHPGQAVPWQGKGVPGIKAGVNVGEGAAREVAAYLLDHHAFASVPPSVLISGSHPTFHVAKRSPSASPTALPEKVGSFQLFVPHFASAEDLGSSLFPVEEVHRIGVLDVRLFNTDRNSDNVLVCPTFPEQRHEEGGSLGSYSSGSPAITFGRPQGGVDSEDEEEEEDDVITASSVVQHWAAYVEEAGEVQEHAEFGSAAGTVPDSVIMKARSVSVDTRDRNLELGEASASLLLSDSLSPSPSPEPEVAEEAEVGPGAGGGVSSPQACRSGKGGTFTRLAHPPRMRPMHFSSSRQRGIAAGRGSRGGRGGRGSLQRLGSEDDDEHDSTAARPRMPGCLFLSADQPGGAELWRLGEGGEQQAPASSSSVPMTVGGWSSPTTLAAVAAAGPQGSTSSSSARPYASPARPRGKPVRGSTSSRGSKAGTRGSAAAAKGGSSSRRRRGSLKMGSLGSPSLCHSARASESGSFDPRELRRATEIKLVPIDHGLCLPHIACLDEAEFGWLYWRQAKKPFTPQVLAYIAELDGEADAELLRRALGHRVREGCLATLRVCTLLLQLAAARGLTLHQIGRIMVRTRYGSPSLLERALAGARGKAVEAAAGEVSLLAGEDGDDRERYDLLMRVVPPFLEQAIECAVSGEEGEECGMPMYNRCRSTTL